MIGERRLGHAGVQCRYGNGCLVSCGIGADIGVAVARRAEHGNTAFIRLLVKALLHGTVFRAGKAYVYNIYIFFHCFIKCSDDAGTVGSAGFPAHLDGVQGTFRCDTGATLSVVKCTAD